MRENLQRFLAGQWPDAHTVEVHEFAAIVGGYSRETYRFDAVVHKGEESERLPLILRKNPPEAASILNTSRLAEHELLLRLAHHTKIPVPKSYFVAEDEEHFGEAAMVIERARGSGMVSHLFNGGPCCDQAESVATHLCELIAELHLTDPKKLNPDGLFDDPRTEGIDPSSWDTYMDTTIAYYLRGYEQIAFSPMPTFYDGWLSLRRDRPRPLPLVLAHGDFNPANFLYEDGRVTALIDWENAHMGDPREDLGWMTLMDQLSNTNIMGSVTKEGGFIPYYNKLTGFNVTPEDIVYFMKFSAANIGLPVVSSVRRRIDREHEELLSMYIFQPVVGSSMVFANLLGYPIPAAGGA